MPPAQGTCKAPGHMAFASSTSGGQADKILSPLCLPDQIRSLSGVPVYFANPGKLVCLSPGPSSPEKISGPTCSG